MDLEDIEYVRAGLRFRGAQGATGTQASFMEIFQNDRAKIDRLNEILCQKAGFPGVYDISTQTYTRKVDLRVANAISALGATAIRIATVSLWPICPGEYAITKRCRTFATWRMTRSSMSRLPAAKLVPRP